MSEPHHPALTIIVPVYNEAGNLERLYERLKETLLQYHQSYEVLFIEDGSRDGSFEILKGLFEREEAVRVVRFIRNFGQQMALAAGFQYARGDVIVLLDADLQVAPEEIPRLVDKLKEGYDIVYGIRTGRVGSLVRRVGSWLMSHLLYRVTGIDVPDSASGFIAMDRRLVQTINLYNERSKYFSGLFAWLSYGRWASVPVSHAERLTGQSKYNVTQLVALTLNFITNFTVIPLRFAFYIGWLLFFLSGGALAWLGLATALSRPWGNGATWLVLLVVILFAGVQLISVGILGEYLGRVYREVQGRPHFVVGEVLSRDEPIEPPQG